LRIAFLDCFSGISGDMMLGALLDVGFEESVLREELARLPLSGYRLEVSREKRKGIEGTRVRVVVDEGKQPHRDYEGIQEILAAGSLPEGARRTAEAIFERIARAEAHIHGVPMSEVHFHEVGAVDSIVDIVGAALGMETLGIHRCYVSSLPLGSGFVQCAHGTLPVPAPATMEILKGMRVREHPAEAELTTPTGAAIASFLAGPEHPSVPPFRIRRVGYGVGARELDAPNLLRIVVGEAQEGYEEDEVQVIECQMDDLQPEIYSHLMERLLQDGAKDVVWIPVQMKKGRPGVLVQVLVDSAMDPVRIAETLFAETTTLGVRFHRAGRIKLMRREGRVQTLFGPVKVKVVEGPCLSAPEVRPEYEDCKRVAGEQGVPLRKVYDAVLEAAASSKAQELPIEKQGRAAVSRPSSSSPHNNKEGSKENG